MRKNLFVGGPWHGRLVEGDLHEQWRVPLPVPLTFDGSKSLAALFQPPPVALYQREIVLTQFLGVREGFHVYFDTGEGLGPYDIMHAALTALGVTKL